VRDLGGRLVLIDAERLSTADVTVDAADISLPDHSGAAVELVGGRGWLRRLAPEDWREGLQPGSHRAVVRAAWLSALVTIVRLSAVRWLSPLDAIFAAEDKLIQQRACRALSIAVPPMALVTRRERIPTELGDPLVVKPLAAGHFRDASGAGRVVHATDLSRSDERLELLAGAPFLVQKRIDARAHLRVVTVRGNAWVGELDAAGLPLDWRADAAAHTSFMAVTRPDLAAAAIRLTRKLGLGYSSQDWVIDAHGVVWFLDLNPAGQWLFLPAAVSEEATNAIARWLVEDDPA
jgi:hypothetical protein